MEHTMVKECTKYYIPTELDQNSELRMFYLANNNSFDIDIKNEYLIGQETIIKGKYISANMTATYKSGSK